jgi:hypothetical protein
MARNVIVKFREKRLDFYLNNPNGEVGRYLSKKGSLIKAAAKRQVGVQTGALRSSIHMRHFRDPRGQYIKVGSPLPYARAHHEGTRPHLIRPNRVGGVLRFETRGQIVFAHLVRHPGTRPNRYLTDNLRLIK